MTEDLINTLEELVRKYEGNIKKYHPAFSHDTSHIAKINGIFKNLNESSPRGSQIKKEKEDKKQQSPVYQFKNKEKEKTEESVKLQPSIISSQSPSVAQERTPSIMSPSLKPNYSRDVSLDKKIVKEHRFGSGSPGMGKGSSREM